MPVRQRLDVFFFSAQINIRLRERHAQPAARHIAQYYVIDGRKFFRGAVTKTIFKPFLAHSFRVIFDEFEPMFVYLAAQYVRVCVFADIHGFSARSAACVEDFISVFNARDKAAFHRRLRLHRHQPVVKHRAQLFAPIGKKSQLAFDIFYARFVQKFFQALVRDTARVMPEMLLGKARHGQKLFRTLPTVLRDIFIDDP